MHVVDVFERHETMQWCINGGGAAVKIEGAVRQKADHAVLVVDTLVDGFQRLKLFHIERGKTIELDRADIAARSLDPEHLDRLTCQRIGLPHFCRGIAAAIIGDALIGAQQIGTIKQLARLIQARRFLIVPTIIQKLDLVCHIRLPIGQLPARQVSPSRRHLR